MFLTFWENYSDHVASKIQVTDTPMPSLAHKDEKGEARRSIMSLARHIFSYHVRLNYTTNASITLACVAQHNMTMKKIQNTNKNNFPHIPLAVPLFPPPICR